MECRQWPEFKMKRVNLRNIKKVESTGVVPDGLWGRSYSDIHVSSLGKCLRPFLEKGNTGSSLGHAGLEELVRSVIGWVSYSSCKRSGLSSCHVQM